MIVHNQNRDFQFYCLSEKWATPIFCLQKYLGKLVAAIVIVSGIVLIRI